MIDPPLSAELETELREKFSYHPPSDAGAARHESLTEAFIHLGRIVCGLVPPGRERALALTNLEQSKFWASAGVARNPETR